MRSSSSQRPRIVSSFGFRSTVEAKSRSRRANRPKSGYISDMPKKSLADQLVRAGLVKASDTNEAKRDRDWRERREKYAAEVAARMDEPPPPAWEPPAKGQIVENNS